MVRRQKFQTNLIDYILLPIFGQLINLAVNFVYVSVVSSVTDGHHGMNVVPVMDA